MGAQMSKKPKESRVLFTGLDGAGKSTILYQWMFGEFITHIPRTGRTSWERLNVESSTILGMEIPWGDFPFAGRDNFRPLFSHYLTACNGMAYVIDSTDRDRLDYAVDELVTHVLLDNSSEKADHFVCMVLANKQDLEGAMPPQEIEEAVRKKMEEQEGRWSQTVFVCPVSAATGDGLKDAFKTFAEQLKLKKRHHTGLVTLDLLNKKGEKKSGDGVSVKSNRATEVYKNSVKYLKSVLFY